MTSNRPYLIRALYEWISDNQMTPHLLVDAKQEGVEVPTQYINNGQIVLNIRGSAVNALRLGNDLIEFQARFSGQVRHIRVPPSAVLAIYAAETGQSMVFGQGTDQGDDEPDPPSSPEPDTPKRPSLRIVK